MLAAALLLTFLALGVAGWIYSPAPRVPISVWWAGQEFEWLEAQAIAAEQERLDAPEIPVLRPARTDHHRRAA